jgi:Flp pilus assembly secretin CpaC
MNKYALAALLLSTTSAMAQPDIVPETIRITQGITSYYRTDAAFKDVSVGSTAIADAIPLTDHALLIEGHKTGTTNMLLLDTQKVPVRNVTIVVDAQGSGFVKIHNKANAASYMEFSCWEKGCQFIGENTVTEPAPLPRGYFNSTYTQGSGGQPVTQPPIPQDNR